jgi:hypothetical protein
VGDHATGDGGFADDGLDFAFGELGSLEEFFKELLNEGKE